MHQRFILSQHRARGFTLIEIIIAIAVVSILATMMVSVFSKVRSVARTATCANNLKQIGLAVRMYVDDNRGFYPYSRGGNPDCEWAETVYPYLKTTQVFWCPSFFNGEFRPGCPPSDTSQGVLPNEVFAWDGSYSSVQLGRGGPVNQVRLRRPASTVLFLDGDGKATGRDIRFSGLILDDEPISEEKLLDFSSLSKRHNGGANLSFADGHVKWLSFDAMREASLWRSD